MAERIVAGGVEAHLRGRLKSVRPLGGGCIGEVYKVDLEDGTPLVAKVDREGESNLDREAYMLRYLREGSDLPVPVPHPISSIRPPEGMPESEATSSKSASG